MNPILANGTPAPSAEFMLQLLLALSLLGNVLGVIFKLKGRSEQREISNDPLVVAPHPSLIERREFDEVKVANTEAHKTFVRHAEFEDHRNGVRAELGKIERSIEALPERISEAFDRRLDEVNDRLKDGAKKMNVQGERIARLEARSGIKFRPTEAEA